MGFSIEKQINLPQAEILDMYSTNKTSKRPPYLLLQRLVKDKVRLSPLEHQQGWSYLEKVNTNLSSPLKRLWGLIIEA